MKPSEYMNLINEIEEKFPVNHWIIDNIHIWPIIRCYMGSELDDSIAVSRKRSIWKYFIKTINSILKSFLSIIIDFKHNHGRLKPVNYVFLTKSITRFKIKGSFYEKFSDSFIDNYCIPEDKCLVLEYTPTDSKVVFRYRKSKNFELHYDLIKAKLLFDSNKHKFGQKLEGFYDLLTFLKNKGINISISFFDTIKYRIDLIQYLAEYFRKILIKVKPKIGFVVCYYETTGYAFVLACKELGIPCVDMQHGVQGDLHVAYGRWNRVPKGGYELLPSYFWCWSNYEVEQINKWSHKVQNKHKAIVGGNLWLKKWQDGDNVVSYYDQVILNTKKRFKNPFLILYTLQTGIEIPEWLLKAINNFPPSWYWWLRLHPGMISSKGYYKKLIKNLNIFNVEIELATRLPLLAILRHSDIHVTAYSSTIVEAQAFNVPSIIISPIGAELYSKQIDNGIASVAYNEEELYRKILSKTSDVLLEYNLIEQNGLNVLLNEIQNFNN